MELDAAEIKVKVIPVIDQDELSAAVIEAIAQRVAELLRKPKPTMAKTMNIDTDSGQVTIDGEVFGFYLAAEPIEYTLEQGCPLVVRLPIFVEPAGFTMMAKTKL